MFRARIALTRAAQASAIVKRRSQSTSSSPAALSVLVSNAHTSMAYPYVGCSITPSLENPHQKHLSTDHDPLFRFHRWLANLRVLEIVEIKSVPYVPVSHPFVERLIGTIRREYLDRAFFWNAVDLERKLVEFGDYYNAYRVHRSLDGTTPAQRARARLPPHASLGRHAWQQHCRGLFQTPIAA